MKYIFSLHFESILVVAVSRFNLQMYFKFSLLKLLVCKNYLRLKLLHYLSQLLTVEYMEMHRQAFMEFSAWITVAYGNVFGNLRKNHYCKKIYCLKIRMWRRFSLLNHVLWMGGFYWWFFRIDLIFALFPFIIKISVICQYAHDLADGYCKHLSINRLLFATNYILVCYTLSSQTIFNKGTSFSYGKFSFYYIITGVFLPGLFCLLPFLKLISDKKCKLARHYCVLL